MKTSLNRLRGRSILDPRAASAEQLFLAPPFTEEVVAAIRLISTRLPLKADEASRLLWQQESNAASEAEYEALAAAIRKSRETEARSGDWSRLWPIRRLLQQEGALSGQRDQSLRR